MKKLSDCRGNKKSGWDFTGLLRVLPWLQEEDFFVSGLEYFRPLWSLPGLMPVLQTVGSVQKLADLSGVEPELQGADPEGFLIVSLDLPQLAEPLLVELFASLDIYNAYLESRPFSYQRHAFALRINAVFSDSGCGSFRNIKRLKDVLSYGDLAEIAEISLANNFSLLFLLAGAVFEPLGLSGLFKLGFAFWLENFHFVSWFLEELTFSELLTAEAKNWLKPLLKPMNFLEREGVGFWKIWQEHSERRPAFISQSISASRMKFIFLMMLSDTINLPVISKEREFLEELSSRRLWWDEALQEAVLPPVFIADWIKVFRGFYLEAFFFCALHSLMVVHTFGFARERFLTILTELVNEELFVEKLLQKAGQRLSDEVKASVIMEQRWRGRLGTSGSLSDFLHNL